MQKNKPETQGSIQGQRLRLFLLVLFAFFCVEFYGPKRFQLKIVRQSSAIHVRQSSSPVRPLSTVSQPTSSLKTVSKHLQQVLKKVAKNNVVLMTSGSKEFSGIMENWLCHMRKLNIKNVIVFALDQETAIQANNHGFASLWDDTFKRTTDSIGVFKSESYLQAVYTKTQHQLAVLTAGYHVFFSDADIPWTADWLTPIVEWADTLDIVLSPGWPWPDLNTGFFFAKSTNNSINLFQNLRILESNLAEGKVASSRHSYTWKGLLEKSDQTCLNFLLMCGLPNGILPSSVSNLTAQVFLLKAEKIHRKWPWHSNKWPNLLTFDRVCKSSNISVKYGVLSPRDFQTGHPKYNQTKWARAAFDNKNVMYHGNYLLGADAKIEAFRKRNRWIASC
eukprot:m.85060 g.85060  ORF g.85060 m.85060 type:complete len:391 (+) comp12993_c0_seq1:272-1444(+)